MSDLDHLAPEVRDALQLPKAERIAFCREDRWVGYTRANNVRDKLDDLVSYPRTLRMPNLLIVGRNGNGKSAILQHFARSHEVQSAEDGTPIKPVLLVEMPDTADASAFWSEILWAMLIAHREGDHPRNKKRQVKSILQFARVRVLVIDEFNNLVNAGRKAGDLLASIRELSNTLKLSIVAAGTQAAINAMNSDPHMKSRFSPVALDRWQLNAEYLRFLASYERLLPLAKPSGLVTREVATRLYAMGGDAIGGTVNVLKAAAKVAIETGTECITASLLEQLDWAGADGWEELARAV